ncbi:MAG: glycosyltransferase [Bacteriovorax sp.]|nr:glycosyltransferase [Bacteriovorax sp.]
MNISVVMVVKNEEKVIRDSISIALKFADEIIVVDTGSHDNTKDILLNEFGIKAKDFIPPTIDKFSIVEARNFGLTLASSDWIMILDADEFVDKKSIDFLKKIPNEQEVDSFFGNWHNFDNEECFWDYKLFLFKRSIDLKYLGKCHSVPQSWLRQNFKTGKFLKELTVVHKKDETKTHRFNYFTQMKEGIKESPDWFRYYWFLGYSLTKIDKTEGIKYLTLAADSYSEIFPVECLNANLYLIEILLLNSKTTEANSRFKTSFMFWEKMQNDFEVIINPYTEWFRELDVKIKNSGKSNFKLRKFGY